MMGGYKPPLYELSNYYFPREDVRADLLVAERTPLALRDTRRGDALDGARGRPRGRRRRLELREPAAGLGGHPRIRRVLLERHGRLARGGRGGVRAPARSAPPRRRPAQLAPHPGAPRRAGAGRELAALRALRDRHADALLPPARRRPHGAAERDADAHPVPVQGHRRLLRRHARRAAPRGHRLDVRDAGPGVPEDRAARLLLQREGRDRGRRRRSRRRRPPSGRRAFRNAIWSERRGRRRRTCAGWTRRRFARS